MNQAEPETGHLKNLANRQYNRRRIHVAANGMDNARRKNIQQVEIDQITGVQNDFSVTKQPAVESVKKISMTHGLPYMSIGEYTYFQHKRKTSLDYVF